MESIKKALEALADAPPRVEETWGRYSIPQEADLRDTLEEIPEIGPSETQAAKIGEACEAWRIGRIRLGQAQVIVNDELYELIVQRLE